MKSSIQNEAILKLMYNWKGSEIEWSAFYHMFTMHHVSTAGETIVLE